MTKAPLFIAALAIAGCATAARSAEEEYRFLRDKGASSADICSAATRARDEWAKERNAKKYDQWKFTAEVDCLKAATERLVLQ